MGRGDLVGMTKRELLKPRVLDSVTRLRKFVELDSPAPLIGHELSLLFRVALAAYGVKVGIPLLDNIRENDLQSRGVCDWDDCTNAAERAPLGLCEKHQKELESDEASALLERLGAK